jgi:NADH:ubiquinone oxidoreductase subunit 5 (subunit L)/multisubunit Na+/H+ antiporter MnhA subunit
VSVGFLGLPVIGPFQDWITVPGHEHHGFETLYNIVLPVLSLVVAGGAIYLGVQIFYRGRFRVDILRSPFAWVYRLLENKYYLDDIYLGAIVKPVQYPLARAAYWTNQHILDGIVDGAAKGTLVTAKFTYETFDQEVVDSAIDGAAGLTGWSGGILRYVQSGNIQRYAAVLFAAIALFVGLFAIT